ncbi:uncharacterized protein [Ptychodera flava]|uniref:uncharacterized protein n=1 Tax=Ptychodera flava TaxID=63121 RepID=UPI00396A3A44
MTYRIKRAISAVLNAKERIEEACFFTEGNKPYWFDLKTELEGIWEDIQKTLASFKQAKLWSGGESLDHDIVYFTSLKKTQFRLKILQDVSEAFDVFREPLRELENLAKPFIDAYDAVFSVITSAKEGYEGLKLGYEFAKTLLNKIFGSKTDLNFPRKFAETSCGGGFFPSTLGNTAEGVDLEIDEGATLVSPFTGNVRRGGTTQVIIAISDEIKDTEVIIDNVDLDDNKHDRLIHLYQ